MKTMQEASRTEPGWIDYGFYASLEDADEFIAVELGPTARRSPPTSSKRRLHGSARRSAR